jgi:D-sedoheptulose 7-phosphate isomerase
VLIAISSSGNSINIRNAVDIAKKHQAMIVTLSGFSESNPLRKMGNINIWLDSDDYGFVEIGHQFLLHNIADRFNPIFNIET